MLKIDDFLRELAFFFHPLAEAVEDTDHLVSFFLEFGYDLEGANPAGVITALDALDPPLGDAFEELVEVVESGGGAIDAARKIFQALSELATSDAIQPLLADAGQFPVEIFDYLTRQYLGYRVPLAVGVLEGLGVLVEREVATSDPDGRDVDYCSVRWEWSRLREFVRDNEQWAYDVYGWGGVPSVGDGRIFDHQLAIARLVKLVETMQLATTHTHPLTAAELAVFLRNNGPQTAMKADLPLVQEDFTDVTATGDPIFARESGFSVLPFGDLNQPSKLGLAIAPYVKGGATGSLPITERLKLQVDVTGQATGGAAIALTPEGISIVNGAAVEADFEFGFHYESPDGKPSILVGEANGSRIQTQAILGSAGGNLTGDFFIAGGFDQLGATIDVSEDGLLGALISGPIEIVAGSILMGWRTGRGVYFEGGTSISVTVPINKQIGPFYVYAIGITLDWKDEVSATGTVTADARLGPLYLYVEGLGLIVTVVPNDRGTFGRFDLAFGLKLPTGYAVALEAAPIEGGGYLSVRDNEYRGALALKFETFGFAAFAILNTKLPGGRPGFSFVASIFGDFVVPLGYGFFLTGLGGLIGINRSVNTGALRQVLNEGHLDSILFPADPIANAATILDSMAAIFPAREGQDVFGPMARIVFSQPPLIEGKLGVVLEVGRQIRILILGVLGTHLPTRDAALVSLEVSFFGEIDFGAGTISIDAKLQNSRILMWPVSGDMAARTGWAPRIDHLVSFGGLHPSYPRPANLPDLRRMSISFGSNNPRISLRSYQAITLSSLQFGASADLYARGPKIRFVGRVAAEGHAYFDALIYFNPFAFDASLGGSLSLLVDGDVVGGLGFDLRLTGPNNFVIKGKVWATVSGIDVGFRIRHEWGDRRELPAAVADPVAMLRQAITVAPVLEPIPATALADGVRFTEARVGEQGSRATSPVGGLRFSQRALPLAIAVEKIGEAQIVGAARTFDLAVFAKDAPVAVAATELDFVRGHFWKMSEAERLRAPTFERHKSGFEIATGDRLRVDTSRAIDVEYGYEFVQIGDDAIADASPMLPFAPIAQAPIARWMEAHHRAHAAPLDPVALVRKAADAPDLKQAGFALVGAPAEASRSFASFQQARAVDAPLKRNPVVADYLLARRG